MIVSITMIIFIIQIKLIHWDLICNWIWFLFY